MEKEPKWPFKRENFATDLEAAEARLKVLNMSEAFYDDYDGEHVAIGWEGKPVFHDRNYDKLRKMVEESGRKDSLHIGFVGAEEKQGELIPQELVLTGAIE